MSEPPNTPQELYVMSAGAARGLVGAISPSFEIEHGVKLHATFGAVGAIRELLVAGAPCDVVILTTAILEPLAREGRVDASTRTPLGRVQTGIATKSGDPAPGIADASALRKSFLAAGALYLPDPERATAGIHCVAILKRLGIAGDMASRLRSYPHGAAAMQALAQSRDAAAVGCTQLTEILYTTGVDLVGTLPPPFALATIYAAALSTTARNVAHANDFLALVTGARTQELRVAGGFETAE